MITFARSEAANSLRRIFGRGVGLPGCQLSVDKNALIHATKQTKKALVDVVKEVAAKLGNKPATCKKYYIHPEILQCYEAGRLGKLAETFRRNHHGYDYEKLVLSLLPAVRKLRAAA